MSSFKNNHITKVAIIGVTGHVGNAFTKSLLSTGQHEITAITREGSSSKIPEGLKTASVDYDKPQTLIDALKDQEVLIITLSATAPKDTQGKIIAAAAEAGVPYVFPNGYGTHQIDTQVGKDTGLGPPYEAAIKQIEDLGVSKWIALCCSFWYEWSLPIGPSTFGFDIKNRAVTFIDDGETVFDTSTWPQCGRAMAALLSLPVTGEGVTLDSYANKPVFMNSFRLTQKDIFQSVLRVTGTKESEWKIDYEGAEKRWTEGRQQMMGGDRMGFAKLLYSRSLAKDGNTFFGDKLVNETLKLPQEDLDEWTKWCVEFVEAGKTWW